MRSVDPPGAWKDTGDQREFKKDESARCRVQGDQHGPRTRDICEGIIGLEMVARAR